MATSYNGWLASANPPDFGGLDNRMVAGAGVRCLPGVRAGDVATVLFYIAAQFHARVQPLVQTQGCWGYSYRADVNDPSAMSCHASGTAIDLNATLHPNARTGTFTAAQIAVVHQILAEVNGVVYWGNDEWGNGPSNCDGMHFEITSGKTAADVHAAAAKVSGVPAPPPLPPVVTGHPGVLAWNLAAGNYYGNIAGPAQSHGGATAVERSFVKNIQQWLIFHGCTPINPAAWSTSGWADGTWGNPTDAAMAKWHSLYYGGQPKPAQCWSDDYAHLARA